MSSTTSTSDETVLAESVLSRALVILPDLGLVVLVVLVAVEVLAVDIDGRLDTDVDDAKLASVR